MFVWRGWSPLDGWPGGGGGGYVFVARVVDGLPPLDGVIDGAVRDGVVRPSVDSYWSGFKRGVLKIEHHLVQHEMRLVDDEHENGTTP